MGIFGRKKTLTERFPAERLAQMPNIVMLNAIVALRNESMDEASVMACRFFAGYLIGYPSYADTVDKMFGARMRAMLFAVIHGEDRGDTLFRRATALLAGGDRQIDVGLAIGAKDGTSFFKALEKGRRTDDAGDAILAAFSRGICDESQTV